MSIVASRGMDQFPVRFPDGMRDEIKAAAERNGRSMNSEILERLSASGIIGSNKTIRDEFAMAALTGMLAAGDYAYDHDNASRDAYLYADAMLGQRQKGGA